MLPVNRGKLKCKLLAAIDIESDPIVESLTMTKSDTVFTLECSFTMLSSAYSSLEVTFLQTELWRSIYKFQPLFGKIGRPGCFVLDVAAITWVAAKPWLNRTLQSQQVKGNI
jgi:hypothetical protein